jgi:hypothetical protein
MSLLRYIQNKGYIMKTYGMTYDDALALARTKRPAIAPNDAFERDLRVGMHVPM